VDADSLLEEESLLRVVKPFIDDPRVVATGGAIRAANGSTVERGRVVDATMPRSWIERVQVLEYLRSFLLGRTGWSRLGALLIISGAFGVFRRDVVLEVGGLDLETLGEDAELVTRIHRMTSEQRRDFRVAFVAEPVCWTEVPHSGAILSRQRRRWSQGLAEILWKHRRMMLNPRYGRIGLVALPYYFLFELIGPIVELTGLPIVALGLAFGLVDPAFALGSWPWRSATACSYRSLRWPWRSSPSTATAAGATSAPASSPRWWRTWATGSSTAGGGCRASGASSAARRPAGA